MLFLVYMLLTGLAVHFEWIAWQENTITSILAFIGIHLSFVLLKLKIAISKVPIVPSHQSTAKNIGSIVDLGISYIFGFPLLGIGYYLGKAVDDNKFQKDFVTYQTEFKKIFDAYQASIFLSRIWIIIIAIWAYLSYYSNVKS